MAKISLIAALDLNNGIGKNNQLLCHLPRDLKHFKNLTLNKPIIMGRNTFISIGSKPLPNRINIVVTKHPNLHDDVLFASSLAAALDLVAKAEEVMVIGGEQLFIEALPLATTLYLTKIHHVFKSDRFFPQFDVNKWDCVEKVFHPRDENNSYDMTFLVYKKNIVLSSKPF